MVCWIGLDKLESITYSATNYKHCFIEMIKSKDKHPKVFTAEMFLTISHVRTFLSEAYHKSIKNVEQKKDEMILQNKVQNIVHRDLEI